MTIESGTDTHRALLELKISALMRRHAAFKRDALIFAMLALIALPLLLQGISRISDTGLVMPLSALIASAIVGVPSYLRERRESKAEASRRQQIYLSIRPDVFNP